MDQDMRRLALALMAGVFACAVPWASWAAAEATTPRPPSDAVAQKPAKIGRASDIHNDDTVVIFNRPIVTFRAPCLGIPPSERASAATGRVVGLLERGGPGKVAVQRLEPGDAVTIDGTLAFLLT